MSRDRRAHQRIACELEITIAGRDGRYALTTRDVSLGGVFVFAREPLSLNQNLELSFAAGDHVLNLQGVVVHHLRGAGFGVQFEEMDAEAETRLTRFLHDVEAAA